MNGSDQPTASDAVSFFPFLFLRMAFITLVGCMFASLLIITIIITFIIELNNGRYYY